MNRRVAIRNLLAAAAGTIFLPGCGRDGAEAMVAFGRINLNDDYAGYLAKICDTFLPLGETAEKTGSPVDFIVKMLNDCASAEDVETYAKGFA